MSDLEDAIREALIQDEGVSVADADVLTPRLVDIARSMTRLISEARDQDKERFLNEKERAELEVLREQTKLAAEDIFKEGRKVSDLEIQLVDAQAMRDRFASALNKVDAILNETGHGVVAIPAPIAPEIKGECSHGTPWKGMSYGHYSMYHKEDHP